MGKRVLVVLALSITGCDGKLKSLSQVSLKSKESSTFESQSSGNLPQAPSVIYMNDYFPTRDNTLVWRYSLDGSYKGAIFLKQVTESRDTLFEQYGSKAVADRPGSTHYVLHDYSTTNIIHPTNYKPTQNIEDAKYYLNSWHMRNHPDGEVAELTDVIVEADAKGQLPICTSPNCPNARYYAYGLGTDKAYIGHGRPGGHRIGETPFMQYPINYYSWYAGNIASVQHVVSNPLISQIWLSNYFPSYTPPQGSMGGLGFRRGGGRTYPGVIEVYFMMGYKVDAANESHCANQPASLKHIPGYNVYWQRALLAPGIGWIEWHILFDEGAMSFGKCQGELATGLLDSSGKLLPGGQPIMEADKWVMYIDDQRPSKDVDAITYTPCADIGLSGVDGYYTQISHSTYDPATGKTSYIWDKNNHCLGQPVSPNAPVANPNPPVVIDQPANPNPPLVKAPDYSAWTLNFSCPDGVNCVAKIAGAAPGASLTTTLNSCTGCNSAYVGVIGSPYTLSTKVGADGTATLSGSLSGMCIQPGTCSASWSYSVIGYGTKSAPLIRF